MYLYLTTTAAAGGGGYQLCFGVVGAPANDLRLRNEIAQAWMPALGCAPRSEPRG